jgi:hypothetical protein
MHPAFAEMSRVELTLYTDALITRGWVRTRQHRVTDILNSAEEPFLILEDVVVEEIGDRGQPIRADFAQINLDSVLFAVADVAVEALPELRTPKKAADAIVSVPPFRITGTIHLLPGEPTIREALMEPCSWRSTTGARRSSPSTRKRTPGRVSGRPRPGRLPRGPVSAVDRRYWLTGRSIRAPQSAQPPSYTATSSWPIRLSTQASFAAATPDWS